MNSSFVFYFTVAMAVAWFILMGQRGELDIYSFLVAKGSFLVMPANGVPNEELSDLAWWRSVFWYFNVPNNLLHTVSSVKSIILSTGSDEEDVSHGLNTTFKLFTPSKIDEDHLKPVIVWLHGGGHVLGNFQQDDAVCSILAHKTNSITISVQYRLAPEYPFPAAIVDVENVLRWIRHRIKSFGGDSTRILLAGESAGGNLAASVTSRNLDTVHVSEAERVSIIGVLLVYPGLDAGVRRESFERYGEVNGMLRSRQSERFRQLYTAGQLKRHFFNYSLSPMRTPDHILKNYPPTIMVLAKYDTLLDDGLDFVEKLRSLGHKQVELTVYNSTIHAFFGKFAFKYGEVALNKACSDINDILASHAATAAAAAPNSTFFITSAAATTSTTSDDAQNVRHENERGAAPVRIDEL